MNRPARSVVEGWYATAAYLLVALVATWPLALGLARDVPRDLGDSVLIMWILAWDAEQILKLLHGQLSALTGFFDANIFHPASLTLAYSEHMLPQAIQMLPLYVVTRNPILCYNLLFLSTFVLSGVGAFLFIRDLTGRPAAAFVGGLLFAFAPYRIAQGSHLQVLSAQWMPFVLWGLRRYVITQRRRPLVGAAVALVVENLSCGYFLLYFPPFVGAYAVWEMWRHAALRNVRIWLQLSIAAVGVTLATLPFLLPYAVVREQLQLGRPTTEVIRYSADVYSYATAFVEQPFWGSRLRAFPKPEGELFPGVVTLILAIVGTLAWRQGDKAQNPAALSTVQQHAEGASPREEPAQTVATEQDLRQHPYRNALGLLFGIAAVLHGVAAVVAIVYRRVTIDAYVVRLRLGNATRVLVIAATLFVAMYVVSPIARVRVRAFMAARGFFVIALLAAIWLSLGPVPQSLGRPVDVASPYGFLYEHVAGFDSVRVPARFGTIIALMLAVLGGYGAAALAGRRALRPIVAAAALLFLAESLAVPMPLNGVTPPPDLATPEARLYRPARAPAVYREIARAGSDAVLAELPLGQPDYDLRAVYYSVVHWRPLLNGYSGFFPPHYGQLVTALSDVPRHADVAIQALHAAGATLVLVHEGAYLGDIGRNTSAALRTRGAVQLFRDGGDVLLDIRPAR